MKTGTIMHAVLAVLALGPLVLHARDSGAATPVPTATIAPAGTMAPKAGLTPVSTAGLTVAPGSLIQLWQPNLATWTTTAMPQGNGLSGFARNPIAYVNNLFIAAGTTTGLGPNVVTNESSSDGVNWSRTNQTFSTTSGMANSNGWLQTAFGYQNGLYVEGFADGAISTSPDGVNWTPVKPANVTPLNAIACGGGKCVFGTSGFFETSNNAVLGGWTAYGIQTSAGTILGNTPTLNYTITGMAYGNGTFVALTSQGPCAGCGPGTGSIITSPDGINWKIAATSTGLTAITYSGGFVAVGIGGGYSTSPDGVKWTNGLIPGATNVDFDGVACAQTVCAATARNGGIWATPINNMSWTSRVSTGQLFGIAYGANHFVAYGYAIASAGLIALTSGSTAPPQ